MRAFAEAYPDFLIVQTPSAQLESFQIKNPAIVQHAINLFGENTNSKIKFTHYEL